MSEQGPFYVNVCVAARLLGVSPESVRRRISRGQLPAVRDKISGRYRIPHEAVMAQMVDVRPAPDPRPVATRPMDPRTTETLRRHGILP